MKRREFMTLLGSAAAWPLAARAQQSAMPVVGLLDSRSPDAVDVAGRLRAFRQGLKEVGYVEGENVAIVYRWAEHQLDRLPELAADLVRRQVAVIVGNTPAALAAKAATTTVPIVFATGGDPVRSGLVASLNRPGGNVTGISFISEELGSKQLGLLRELRPGVARIAVLVDPKWPLTQRFVSGCGFGRWAATHRPRCHQRPRNRDRLYNARPTWGWRAARGHRRVHGLSTGTDCRAGRPTRDSRDLYLARSRRCRGLMSYAPSITDANRQAGIYAGRILKGEKPGDLPVMLPTAICRARSPKMKLGK
jgi:putative tryptophan/tyrosine transport system substrate-binding protein